jgi:hypothetical protein
MPSIAKTLNQSAYIHEKFRSAAAIEGKVQGTEVYVPAPCRDGELPPEPSPSVTSQDFIKFWGNFFLLLLCMC